MALLSDHQAGSLGVYRPDGVIKMPMYTAGIIYYIFLSDGCSLLKDEKIYICGRVSDSQKLLIRQMYASVFSLAKK